MVLSADAVKGIARAIGFDAVGIAPAALLSDEVSHLRAWVAAGKHAGMGYMARNMEVRENSERLVPGARSVVVTLTNYYSSSRQAKGIPQIAMYARGKDYHLVIKERLHALLQQLRELAPGME